MKRFIRRTLRYVAPAAVAALSLGYLSASLAYLSAEPHLLWVVPSEGVLYNSRPLPLDAPYVVHQTSGGDLFCEHLRGGPQYLVSPARGEVSVITNAVEVEYFGPVAYTREVLTDLRVPQERTPLPDARLAAGGGYVEFTGLHGARWRISY